MRAASVFAPVTSALKALTAMAAAVAATKRQRRSDCGPSPMPYSSPEQQRAYQRERQRAVRVGLTASQGTLARLAAGGQWRDALPEETRMTVDDLLQKTLRIIELDLVNIERMEGGASTDGLGSRYADELDPGTSKRLVEYARTLVMLRGGEPKAKPAAPHLPPAVDPARGHASGGG